MRELLPLKTRNNLDCQEYDIPSDTSERIIFDPLAFLQGNCELQQLKKQMLVGFDWIASKYDIS
jgi:hypothetical protein